MSQEDSAAPVGAAPIEAGSDPGFLRSIVSGSDIGVDTIYLCGLLLCAVLCGATIYVAIVNPAGFSPVSYAAAGATLLGAMSGAKTLRDNLGSSNG